jgi:hypothetical protein
MSVPSPTSLVGAVCLSCDDANTKSSVPAHAYSLSGKYPTYMRAPYTDCTVESGCQGDLKALGYHSVHYDLTTEDYMHPHRDEIQLSKDLVKEALGKAPKDGNLLVLQHDIIPQSSGNLTEFILQLVRDKEWKGMSFRHFTPTTMHCANTYL